MKVINYFTKNTPYEFQANQLKENLKSLDIDYKTYETNDLGSWELNCAQKSYILGLAIEETEDDIFYVDCDALFLQKPNWEEFNNIDVPSFLIYEFEHNQKNYWELFSGSIYFPNNKLSRAVINAWKSTQERYPYQWDQQTLQAVVDQNKIPFVKMPFRWCVTHHMKNVEDPVITHHSISRQYKDLINGKSQNQ
jgi:hypothetical protein